MVNFCLALLTIVAIALFTVFAVTDSGVALMIACAAMVGLAVIASCNDATAPQQVGVNR